MKFVTTKTGYNETEIHLAQTSKDKIKKTLYWGWLSGCLGIVAYCKVKQHTNNPTK